MSGNTTHAAVSNQNFVGIPVGANTFPTARAATLCVIIVGINEY
jgi:hypothetical protein